MPVANVRGASIHYEVLGKSGPWVALAPGGRRPITAVRSLAQKVADAGYRVLVHDRRVTFKRMDLAHDPSAAFRLYRSVARENLPPDPEARDAISAFAADREWCKRLRRQDEAAAVFSQLLTRAEPVDVRRGSLLQELHEVGLVIAMIPELEVVTGRVRQEPGLQGTSGVVMVAMVRGTGPARVRPRRRERRSPTRDGDASPRTAAEPSPAG